MITRFTQAAVAAAALLALAVPAASARTTTTVTKYDAMLAPETACAGQSSSTAAVAAQTATMRCLVNYARSTQGLKALNAAPELATSSQAKANDILRCQDFSHTACGRTWDFWIRSTGVRYTAWAENIAWGSDNGGLSTPRAIMHAWLNSDGHRTNILNARYNSIGVGLARGKFSGYTSGVWVQHFATK